MTAIKLPKFFNDKITDDAIDAQIKNVATKAKSLNDLVQKLLTTVMVQWHQSGDVQTCIRHMDNVLDNLGTGVRNNAVKAWIEAFCGFSFVKDEDTGKQVMRYNSKNTKISMDDVINAHQNPWNEFKPEPEFVPFDFDVKLAQLVATAKKRMDKKLEGDKIDLSKITTIESIL